MASPVLPFSFSTTSWPSWPVAPVTAMVMACMLLDWTEKPAYHGGGPRGNLACKKLNLEMLIERRARAQERRVVPETRQGGARLPTGQTHHQVHQQSGSDARRRSCHSCQAKGGVPAGIQCVARRADHSRRRRLEPDFHRRL